MCRLLFFRRDARNRVTSKLFLLLLFCYVWALLLSFKVTEGAEGVIKIPWEIGGDEDGVYRLSYEPPQGLPPSNSTFRASDIAKGIELTQALPSTEYNIGVFYTNETLRDWLMWTATITTAPDPPRNLSVNVRSGRAVQVAWSPPLLGNFSAFKLKVVPLSEQEDSVKSLILEPNASPFNLRNLTPGASYEVQVSTIFENKESSAYVSTNFTSQPNSPGRFIVWFRNETTLLVLWQPPYPPGIYSHYRVSISPSDALESVRFVEKEGEPPGPAQAPFYGLVPGRAYNISVQTVSELQTSSATTAQYRTVPLAPRNVTFPPRLVTTEGFTVLWEAPQGFSEFDRYQISLGLRRPKAPLIVPRDESRAAEFSSGLDPGKTYTVVVKTVSGNVASWPATGNVTTRPLPVLNLHAETVHQKTTVITWRPHPDSIQDAYQVTFTEVGSFNGASSSKTIALTEAPLDDLLPGRNYSIVVKPLSNGIAGEEVSIFQVTNPAPPIIESVIPVEGGLNVSWKWDVLSRQDRYAVTYDREDTGQSETVFSTEPHVSLRNLYPGAGYSIQVFAISYDLWSEPHVQFQAVPPRGPADLRLTPLDNASVKLEWHPPEGSLYTGFSVRHRPLDSGDSPWTELPMVKETSIQVDELMPGEEVLIQVNTVSHQVESSEPLSVTHIVRPAPVSSITPRLSSSNITFIWPAPSGRVDLYHVEWSPLPTNDQPVRGVPGERQVAATALTRGSVEGGQTAMTVDQLFPGQKYRFAFKTTSHETESSPVTLEVQTLPVITSEVYLAPDKDHTDVLTVRYTVTPSVVSILDSYRFALTPSDEDPVVKEGDDEDRKIRFSDLRPGQLYNVTAWTVAGGVLSEPLVRRSRQYPNPISGLEATKVADTYVILSWDSPGGHIDAYEVQYLTSEKELQANISYVNRATVTGLEPYKNYTFTVVSVAGTDNTLPTRSLPVASTFQTLESVPGKVEYFRVVKKEPTSLSFVWSLSPDEEHGILTGFTIRYRIKDVQRYSSWPPYQANEPYFPFASNNSFVDFTIGTESCEGKTHYCNGPLKPGTAYRIKVRAFTSREKYADTSWSPPIETLPSGSGAYVGAVVGSLLILLVVVVLFLMRRYHVGPCRGPLRAKPRHSGPHHGHHHHHHSKGTVGDDSLSLPDSVIVTNRPVKLKDFAEHYRIMSADSDFRFSEEYEELKHVGRDQGCGAADLPCNRPKNRFTNILPYDHSRFKLQPTDDEEASLM
ncbi:unnamed protein product [Cyprideis torosa]|uniref:protein-tyrosine-phosphatase n=1 Tax=Cyprideis torosa TaxID=163714 RepID=A0A7R8ZH73_9CRUS|nr:unnamed protein product [Cyprideis torosa]CAG0882993.1 unnamed protein product [Cyprideis torosa]